MSILKRLFRVGRAEAHSLVNSLEEPIKMTELGIRDLKIDLDQALKTLAEVKAMSIRSTKDVEQQITIIADYEKKAMQLLESADKGNLSQEEADRLAAAALQKQKETSLRLDQSKKEKNQYDSAVAKLEANVAKIKENVSTWENELKTLKSRAKVSEVTKNVNKQLTSIDSSGTVPMLERMKEKVEAQEALAESYSELADASKSLDEEIDKALESDYDADSALAQLKAKMKKD